MPSNTDIIRLAREMEKITGVPSSQLRRVLRSETQQERRTFRQAQQQPTRTPPSPSSFAPSSGTFGFAAKPFAPPPVPQKAGGTTSESLPTETFDVLKEGVLVEYDFYAFETPP